MAFSEETIQQVWEKATPVAGNDPAVWRQDQCKAWIGRRFYGNRNSEYGWEIDHIVPVSKGEKTTFTMWIMWYNRMQQSQCTD